MMLKPALRPPMRAPLRSADSPREGVGVWGESQLTAYLASLSDGLYYDTTKLDRFFQESVGPTLADDIGEAMGLALDQRTWGGQTLAQVVAAETELTVNGDFAVDANWVKTQATISGGAATINSPDGTFAAVAQAYAVSASRTYAISFDVVSISSGTVGLDFGNATNVVVGSGTGRKTVLVSPGVTPASLNIKRVGGVTQFVVDNVSVKLVPGNHALQATGTLKPTRQATGAKFDGSDDNWLTPYLNGASSNFMVGLITVPASISAFQVVAGMTTGPDRWNIGINTDGTVGFGSGTLSGTLAKGITDVRNTELVVGMSSDGADVLGFVGAALENTSPLSAALNTSLEMRLGANNALGSAANFFGGSVKKFVAGRDALTLARYLQIRSALLAA